MNECKYNRIKVCEILGISTFILDSWYRWQKCLLNSGEIVKEYLPHPQKKCTLKGQPLMWSEQMIEMLKAYQEKIIHGRNGRYGRFTNKKARRINR